jgi:molecular chaperone Hsp33
MRWIVRLGPLASDVLGAHSYPAPVAQLLAEALALTALIGSVLGGERHQMTLQARSDGPVNLLVADYAVPGQLRGYCAFDADKVAPLPTDARLETLCGTGYLALTFDQPGAAEERYQGIVELEGANLADAAQRYFETSEQIPTFIRLATRYDGLRKAWTAGGLLIQHLPKGEVGGVRHFAADSLHPNWETALALAHTTSPEELTDPALSLDTLLWRLFHDQNARVFDSQAMTKGCRCTRERIQSTLRQFSFDQLMDMREADGSIRVNCAFCSKDFVFERPSE